MHKETLEAYLKEHHFFRGLSDAYMPLLNGCARINRFDAGDMIFRQGEPAEQFYLIRHGTVAVEVHTPQRGIITIQTVVEGDILGWSWLLDPYVCRFDARAVTLTRVLALDGPCLREKCDNDPALGYALLKRIAGVMARRLEAARLQLMDIYGDSEGATH